jgi:hypothetical protein
MKAFITFAVLAIFSLSLSSVDAAPAYGQSVIYLDSTGYVVGQQIMYCNSYKYHGGDISSQYKVEISTGCGGQNIHCGPNSSNDIECMPTGQNNYGASISDYNLPPGLSISDECAMLNGECSNYPSRILGSQYGFSMSSGFQ